ncbi:MAG: L,D-transpeptidase [Pseudolabrys sp.]
MIRPFAALLLTLPAIALAGPAEAQSTRAPSYRGAPAPDVAEQRLPPRGGWIFDDEDDVAYGRSARRGQQAPGLPSSILPPVNEADAAPLPPPGFLTPDGRAPAGLGHQLDSRQPPPAAAPQDRDIVMRPPGGIGAAAPAATQPGAPPPVSGTAALPPEDQPEEGQPKELPAHLKKQLVDYTTKEPAGTIVVDTSNTYLYLVLGGGKAIRYGIGVGREGFTWTGAERVSRMSEWPDWHPPAEMIERQPYLPRFMAGGPGNPLGARALYLGKTLYRIHGTNQPSTIGQNVSSGCIRLLNEDIEDLYSRVQVGSRVVVLPGKSPEPVSANAPASTGAAPAPAPATGTAPTPARASISSSPLPAAR